MKLSENNKPEERTDNTPLKVSALDTAVSPDGIPAPTAPKAPDWAIPPVLRTAQEQSKEGLGKGAEADTQEQSDDSDDVSQAALSSGIDPNTRRPLLQGVPVTKNILFCNDGVYRWLYVLRLFRRPVYFFLIWKIFFIITTAIFAITTVVDAVDWGRSLWESILSTAPMYGYFTLGMTGLVILGYLIYAAAAGGKFTVIYEMDEKGVRQKQSPWRAVDPQVRAEAAAGLRSDRISSIAVTEMTSYSDFSRVKKIKIYPLSRMIKLREGFSPDRIYAEKEDFEFVQDFIIAHCRDLKKLPENDEDKPEK